ncbi:MAG: HD-GYP domain-containing protein [Gammaproteobacteria bacterium]|nr:HD-GYP domain-containing protein [Gammaproteobacteria bacterium]
MSEKLKKISSYDLKPGMYVSNLDRPWEETPFLFQGMEIKSSNDILELQKHCQYVYIDIDQGLPADQYLAIEQPELQINEDADIFRVPTGFHMYPEKTSFKEEFVTAKEKYNESVDTVQNVLNDIRKGRKLQLAPVRKAVDGIISSIIRNPDAFLWLTRLKTKDEYTYAHCVDACGLAVAFGRHLGLQKNELELLAIGTLLIDIGKMKIPQELLCKQGALSESEIKLFRNHVNYSVDIIMNMHGMNNEIISIVQNHHERFNGQGYPQGISGNEIPIFARIAAVVDCYDAITSNRIYAKAISSYEAIHMMYEWRDKDFQAEVIEQFIQCLGIYPTGTIVELTSGEIGIIYSQNRIRRLKPKIMLVLDKNKQSFDFNPTIDLIKDTHDKNGIPIEILCAHEPGSFGINLRDYYL